MYFQDYDETVPLLYQATKADGSDAVTWQDTVQPYVKSYGLVFCPDNFFRKQDHTQYYDYFTNYGIMGSISIINEGQGTSYSAWRTRTKPWFQKFCPPDINYNGLGGGFDAVPWFTSAPMSNTSTALITSISIGNPNNKDIIINK